MVFFNYSTMQMAAKVVYYGPGLCGKTTNLQWIYGHTSNESRGEMVSLATETDRTLFFDLLPIDVGSIAGFSTRIQLYTVPGQVFYNTTRKLVLKGVDGVVFVADSQRPMVQANKESFQNLEENLAEIGLSLETIPLVLQYNKRDLSNICSVEELDEALNRQGWPTVEASALDGTGVFETLKTVSRATLLALKKRLTKGRPDISPTAAPRSAVAAPPRVATAAPTPVAAPPKPVAAPPKPAVAAPTTTAPAAAAPAAAPAPSPSPASPTAGPSSTGPASPGLDATRPEPVPTTLDPARLDAADEAAPPTSVSSEEASEVVEASLEIEEAAAGEDLEIVFEDAPPEPDLEPDFVPSPQPVAAADVEESQSAASEVEPTVETGSEVADEPDDEPVASTPAAAPSLTVAPPAAVTGDGASATTAPTRPLTPAPATSAPATVASATPAAKPAPRPPRARAGGVDALAELEKIRQATFAKRPAPVARNGRGEISRDFEMRLSRGDLHRARRFSLTLRVEDADHRVVDERSDLHIEIDDPSAIETLLLRLNIALDSSS